MGHLQKDSLELTNPSFIWVLIKASQNPLQEEEELLSFEPVETYNNSEIILDYFEKVFLDKIISKDIIKDLEFGRNFYAWNSSQNQGLYSETCYVDQEAIPALIEFLVNFGFKALEFQ